LITPRLRARCHLRHQNYGIALPLGSPLRQAVNLSVLDAVESKWWQQTVFQ
jgi:polar amino acid transport system substrate-binding protein